LLFLSSIVCPVFEHVCSLPC